MSDDHRYEVPLEALLAGPEEVEESPAVLVFEAGGRRYGLDASGVEAVVACRAIAPLPYPPQGVVGVAAVRGRMRLVVDLGTVKERATRLVVLHGDAQLAILAERVAGVVTAPADGVEMLDVDALVAIG